MTWIYKAEIDCNDTKLILDDTKERGEYVVLNNSIRFKPILESANGEYICVVKVIDGTVVNATFVLNATKCRPNYHGEVCSEKCDCQYGGTCDSGLSELARLKIVHRDIAARNIVISDRKVAKIADFGLSRDVYVSSAYKRTNQGGEEELLPLKWMALESLRDGVYTCESDVWSYGVLLWEIASFGEEPRYAGGPMHPDVCTLLELLRKGVRLQQPENCPLSVYRIIRSCWIVDPSKRPTPEELLQKIDQLMPRRDASQS
uniref:Protein kinase domain-containing protein n=1 Tax=Branchiostoma floridae TaxID=7739 RepID=C3XUT9_BRAFL|eukprot:XP_002612155.1 hypothetical protein BRAFLDRAFT_88894 [Branchiostoma floridae]